MPGCGGLQGLGGKAAHLSNTRRSVSLRGKLVGPIGPRLVSAATKELLLEGAAASLVLLEGFAASVVLLEGGAASVTAGTNAGTGEEVSGFCKRDRRASIAGMGEGDRPLLASGVTVDAPASMLASAPMPSSGKIKSTLAAAREGGGIVDCSALVGGSPPPGGSGAVTSAPAADADPAVAVFLLRLFCLGFGAGASSSIIGQAGGRCPRGRRPLRLDPSASSADAAASSAPRPCFRDSLFWES